MDYKIILKGIVGSHAYGLNTPESDVDVHGIFVYPTSKVLSLHKGDQTFTTTDPDTAFHEVEKFVRLASKCNPTVLELLYLNDYQVLTEEGKMLVDNREYFLSKKIYHTYGGYALAQAKKLYKKGMNFTRYAKHARHCFRLLLQGKQLLSEGDLTIKVSKEVREYLLNLGEVFPESLLELFDKEYKQFDKIESSLPDSPNWDKINKILLQIRRMNYE